MLQKKTVETRTLELLIRLMKDKALDSFFLVGGTALALQIGHRKSIDIDLFRLLNQEKGIRFAGLRDIAAMILNAIVGNGIRLKDFTDVAFLSSHLCFADMLDAYCKKYASVNPVIAAKAITFFGDIDFSVPIELIQGKFQWKKVESRINQMLRHPDRIFEQIKF